MSAEFTIDFPAQDVAKFWQAADRLRSELGRSNKAATTQATKQLLSSLGVSTKVADQHRKFEEVGTSRSGKNKIFKVTTKYQTPKRKGKALRRSWQGPFREQLIYAKNKSEAKKRPALIIAMRGVAKESWTQAGRKGRINIKIQDPVKARYKRIVTKAARRWVEFISRFNENEQYIRVINRMRHIVPALQGGMQSVNTAMSRAAEGLEKAITRELDAKAKKLARSI